MDFETFSTAGYNFDEDTQKWRSVVTSAPHGLGAVGASVYTEHPSAEVLCLAWDLKDGVGPHLWIPGMEPPHALFDHLANGGVVEAWNSSFEFYVWNNICVKRMGWPVLDYRSLRCAMSKSRAFSRPGQLEKAGEVAGVKNQKIKDGQRLLTKFSKGRNPTKRDKRRRIKPEEDFEDAQNLYDYCIGDIKTEAEVSARTPDLLPEELDLWLLDQKINFRGVHVDPEALANCKTIIEQATVRYTAELVQITGGTVQTVDELDKMKGWLGARGLVTPSLDIEHVEKALKNHNLPPDVRRILEIRQILGSASVKKVFAIDRMLSGDGRMHDLFAFFKAHTGRFAGQGPQPQNLPKSGPKIFQCDQCKHCYTVVRDACPWCNCGAGNATKIEWGLEAVEDALQVIATRSLETVEHYFGDAIDAVSGCLRALFCAAPGHEFICSDFSAIEAVVLAMLSKEQWRIDVFKTHGKIYEASASMITGIPLEEFMRYKEETGDHHPQRNKIGKYAELASQYQGWVGAWKQFGADEHLTDDQIEEAVKKWRATNPMIVKFWAGLESAAVQAIQNPGDCFQYNGIAYGVLDDVLYCQLPSGRCLSYHQPRLNVVDRYGKPALQISYMGWNTDYKKGPKGWMRLDTYGGKLTENVVQAIARDILVFAMRNLEAAGYWIVLHVHDEAVAEVLRGFGSIEEFERIMSTMPPWAQGWPIFARGGWRGHRYRKD